MSSSSSSSLGRSVGVLLGLLVILPGWLTWAHLRHVQQQQQQQRQQQYGTPSPTTTTMCHIQMSPDHESQQDNDLFLSSVAGRYRSVPFLPSSSVVGRPVYQQERPVCFWSTSSSSCRTFPRLESAAEMATRVLQQRQESSSIGVDTGAFALHYNPETHQWCFVGAGPPRLCTAQGAAAAMESAQKQDKDKFRNTPHPPPHEQWHLEEEEEELSDSSNQTIIWIDISCKSPPDLQQQQQQHGSLRKQQRQQNRRRNRNMEQIVERPATTLLLCVNVLLAFLYWNGRVSPSSVAKVYQRMVQSPFEVWRALTGAMAHFEPLHLGFNMMALYSLGLELEGRFHSSIAFLGTNLCLILWTTLLLLAMIYGRLRFSSSTVSHNLAETSTVGYSGVLFAWMVVTALQGRRTCPVAFFPQVCFETHDFWGWQWNVAPLVQLVVAQVIMPRASFMGHLAGIACGYALVWKVIPQPTAPQVWFPLVHLLHLAWLRNMLGATHCWRGLRLFLPSGAASSCATWMLLWGYMAMLLLSVILVDSTLILSGFLTLVFLLLTAQQQQQEANATQGASSCSRNTAILARGATLSLVFTIVTDVMAIVATLTMLDRTVMYHSCVFMSLRICLHLVALVGWILPWLKDDVDSHGGIFHKVLGWVVQHGLVLHATRPSSSSSFAAFEGTGHVLGNSTSGKTEPPRGSLSASNTVSEYL